MILDRNKNIIVYEVIPLALCAWSVRSVYPHRPDPAAVCSVAVFINYLTYLRQTQPEDEEVPQVPQVPHRYKRYMIPSYRPK